MSAEADRATHRVHDVSHGERNALIGLPQRSATRRACRLTACDCFAEPEKNKVIARMPDIALIAPLDVESHEVVRGVFDFAASTPDWNVHWFPGCGNATVQQIEQWKPTGVISVCGIDQREVVRSMVALGTPLVNIGHLSGVCSFFPSTRAA